MIKPDDKHLCLKQLENAYSSLQFYYELKEKNEHSQDFAQTVFSLNEHAIAKVAEVFELNSSLKEHMNDKSKENKERNLRILELEKEIASKADITLYKKNVQEAFEAIRKTWTKEGFAGSYNGEVDHYGNIKLKLNLEPIREAWDLLDEENYEELFNQYRNNFLNKKLETIKSGGYEYVIENDANKQKIEALVTHLFPSIEIWDWNRTKVNGGFALSRADVAISDLSFLEGKK